MKEILMQLLASVLGYALAYLIRLKRKHGFWSQVKDTAVEILRDEANPITDPAKATEKALVEVQRPQLEIIEREVKKSIPPIAGHGGSGMLDPPSEANEKPE